MTPNDDFGRSVSAWLREDAEHRVPDHLAAVLRRTDTERQRPAWSSLERWLPVQLTFSSRLAPIPRLGWAVVVVVLIVLAAAAFVAVGGTQKRLPHFGAAANGAIAFSDGNTLKVAAADGSNVRVATTFASGAESMTFSPDGTRLAYRTTGTPASIVVAGLDGSHPVVISNGLAVAESAQIATAGSFAWAPDSLRLAFTRQVNATIRTIDVAAADGSHLTQLLPDSIAGALDRYDPKWSPDGRWIAFFSTDAAGSMAVNLIRPDGTDERRLPTSAANPAYAELSWDPDPARTIIEFVSGDEVKLFDVATAKETSVGFGFWASWAPDARHISWWDASPGNPGASTAGGIQIARVDQVLAGQRSHVPLFPGATNGVCYSRSGTGICAPAQWSPDSRWIFGPDPTGTSIVFSTLDVPATVRTIALDHAADLSNGPQGTLAWQAIAP